MMRGLLLIDFQNDYFTGGALPLVDVESAADNARELLHVFRQRELPVIHIQHLSVRPGATFFIPDTRGAEIHSSVNPDGDEIIIQKHFPNSFRDTGLLSVLKERAIDELVICGAMTHMCIDASTRAAFDFNFNCTVVSDACATRDLEFDGETVSAKHVQSAFLAALAVPYATISRTHQIVNE